MIGHSLDVKMSDHIYSSVDTVTSLRLISIYFYEAIDITLQSITIIKMHTHVLIGRKLVYSWLFCDVFEMLIIDFTSPFRFPPK